MKGSSKVKITRQEPRQVCRRPALPLRRGRGRGPGRHHHRPGLDRGRRRAAADRGRAGAGQGPRDRHRQAGRCDEGIGAGGQRLVRSRATVVRHQAGIFEKRDIHVHVPEGATPKDGPSAGVAMVTSIVSALTGIPVRKDVAMTGEITLRGRVLPIGGLKEKLLAALRGGLKTVLIPEGERARSAGIPDNVKKGLEIVPVATVDEVLARALGQAAGRHRMAERPARPCRPSRPSAAKVPRPLEQSGKTTERSPGAIRGLFVVCSRNLCGLAATGPTKYGIHR